MAGAVRVRPSDGVAPQSMTDSVRRAPTGVCPVENTPDAYSEPRCAGLFKIAQTPARRLRILLGLVIRLSRKDTLSHDDLLEQLGRHVTGR
jgi:hypothetical protein